MATTKRRTNGMRPPLDRQRVLEAAVELADREGLASLSMRKLGGELGVEAMSLYNHVANKDDLLDGIVDVVAGEFESPASIAGDWRTIIRRCAMAEHAALLRHPWVAALAETRVMTGPVRLGYYDALLGVLRESGFSDVAAYRANLVLDSYVYGFTLQEVSWPVSADSQSDLTAAFIDRTVEETFPNLVEIAQLSANGLIDIGADFEVGLDALLDSLVRIRELG